MRFEYLISGPNSAAPNRGWRMDWHIQPSTNRNPILSGDSNVVAPDSAPKKPSRGKVAFVFVRKACVVTWISWNIWSRIPGKVVNRPVDHEGSRKTTSRGASDKTLCDLLEHNLARNNTVLICQRVLDVKQEGFLHWQEGGVKERAFITKRLAIVLGFLRYFRCDAVSYTSVPYTNLTFVIKAVFPTSRRQSWMQVTIRWSMLSLRVLLLARRLDRCLSMTLAHKVNGHLKLSPIGRWIESTASNLPAIISVPWW